MTRRHFFDIFILYLVALSAWFTLRSTEVIYVQKQPSYDVIIDWSEAKLVYSKRTEDLDAPNRYQIPRGRFLLYNCGLRVATQRPYL